MVAATINKCSWQEEPLDQFKSSNVIHTTNSTPALLPRDTIVVKNVVAEQII